MIAALDFPIGGGSPKPPQNRGDWLVHGCGDWNAFIATYARPAVEQLGWDKIVLHLPGGRRVEPDGGFEKPMPFATMLDAAEDDHYLARGFWWAWHSFCLQYPRATIGYLGAVAADPKVRAALAAGRPELAIERIVECLGPIIQVYGMDLALDAVFDDSDAGPDDLAPALVRLLESLGQPTFAEPNPFKTQRDWAAAMRVITGLNARRHHARTLDLAGELLMFTEVKFGRYRQEDRAQWLADFVAANRAAIPGPIASLLPDRPGTGVIIERGDVVVDAGLRPEDFGIRKAA